MYNVCMRSDTQAHSHVNVADEVFLVVADLHRRHPEADDFSVREILDHAKEMRLSDTLRKGFEIHVRQHSVANLPRNPGSYRTLYASGKARRRLLRPGDEVHPTRTGKIWPEVSEIPEGYRDLVEWARRRFGREDLAATPLASLMALRGSGRHIWSDEHADEYVKRLRSDWS